MGFIGGVVYGIVNEIFWFIWIIKFNCIGNEMLLDQCVKDKDFWGYLVYFCRFVYVLCYRYSKVFLILVEINNK